MKYEVCRKCEKRGVYLQKATGKKVCRYCGATQKIEKWTQFHDMHSGGGQKEDFARLYIEAPEDEACRIFYAKFGHSPHRVTCTCCGEDYSVSEYDSLEQATAYDRNCRYAQRKIKKPDGSYTYDGFYLESGQEAPKGYTVDDRFYSRPTISLEEYLQQDNVRVIREDEIKDHERQGDIPQQGYVWVG
jgi:hypothetical protein